MAFIVAFATIFSTLLGGLFAIRFKDKLHLILGFSAGAVMGAAFFELLPESFNLSNQSFDIKLTSLLIAAGFVGYLLIDRFISLHAHNECEQCEKPQHSGNLAAAALVLHSFLDGLGIGLAFKVSSEIGFLVTAAVLAHDFSDGINTVNMILKNKGNNSQAIAWLAADAVAPALGVLVAVFLTVSSPVLGLILAVFTGLFLYIGASDLVPESHHRHPTVWTTVMTVLGIAMIYLIINLVE